MFFSQHDQDIILVRKLWKATDRGRYAHILTMKGNFRWLIYVGFSLASNDLQDSYSLYVTILFIKINLTYAAQCEHTSNLIPAFELSFET